MCKYMSLTGNETVEGIGRFAFRSDKTISELILGLGLTFLPIEEINFHFACNTMQLASVPR